MDLLNKFGWRIAPEEYAHDYVAAAMEPPEEHLVFSSRQERVYRSSATALAYYMSQNLQEATKYARKNVESALDYFFGDWRSFIKTDLGTLDVEWWHINIGWIRFLQESLCWASTIKDWEAIEKLATYPTDYIKPGFDGTKQEKALYLALSAYVLGKDSKDARSYLERAETGSKKKPQVMAPAIAALWGKDQGEFQDQLFEYLKFFKKSEFRRNQLTSLLSFDGTTLLNLAKKKGWRFELPPDLVDTVIIM